MKTVKTKNRLVLLVGVILLATAGLNFGQDDTWDYFNYRTGYHFDNQGFSIEKSGIIQKIKAANQYFKEGKEHFLKKEYPEAEKKLAGSIEALPQQADAHFFLSRIHYEKGDYYKALIHIRKAKESVKFMTDLYARILKENSHRLREYKSDLEAGKHLTHDTWDGPCFTNIAEVTNKEKIIEVDSILSQISKSSPSKVAIPADYFYFHGNIFFKLKKYREAFAQYLQAVEINPKHGNAYINLANLYYMGKNYSKALACLIRAEKSGAAVKSETKEMIKKHLM